MGTLSHHQAKAHEFLQRADCAITTRDPGSAAVALRRAATHMTTALAVHQGWKTQVKTSTGNRPPRQRRRRDPQPLPP